MSEKLTGLAAAASGVGVGVCSRPPGVCCRRPGGFRRAANAVLSRWRRVRYGFAGRAVLALALLGAAPVIAAAAAPFDGVPIPNGASPWIGYRDWYAQTPGKPYSAMRSENVALAPGVLLLSSFQGNQVQRQKDALGAYTTWIDQSGNGFNWTQPSTWFQPAFVFTEGGVIAGHFAGGGQRLEYDDGPTGTMADLLSVDHGYMIVRFAITAPPGNDSATAVANPALIAPSVEAPTMGIYIKGSAAGPPYVAQIVNVDGDGEDALNLAEVEPDTYHTAEWRHEGGQLYGRIDGGAWTQVASGDTIALSASGRLGHA